MDVNCNGHASTPQSEASPESQAHGTKRPTEEQEDQQNANCPENTEIHDTLENKVERVTSNGSAEDLNSDLLQLPISLDSGAVDLNEGDKPEKKEEGKDMQGETKSGPEDEDSQKG